MLASCESDMINLPFVDYKMKREKLAQYLVYVDLAVFISLLIFVYVVQVRSNEYSRAFNIDKVGLNEFTIRVDNLPEDE